MTTMTKTAAQTAAAAPAGTDSYAASYARLAAIAERLRTATGAATVDSLVADVQAARELHRQLKTRLDAVRRELDADAESELVTVA